MSSCPNVVPPATCVDPLCPYCVPRVLKTKDYTTRLLSNKLAERNGYASCGLSYAHWCPGCKGMHDFAVKAPFHNNARWSFNENVIVPTFTPSMNIVIGPFPDGHKEVCHYFLTDGKILFLGDCTHALKGQTVDLPDIPAEALKWATIVREE